MGNPVSSDFRLNHQSVVGSTVVSIRFRFVLDLIVI